MRRTGPVIAAAATLALLAGCADVAPPAAVEADLLLEVQVDDERCTQVQETAAAAEHGARSVVLAVQVSAGAPPPTFTPTVRTFLVRAADQGATVRILRFTGRDGVDVGREIAVASASTRRDNRATDIAFSLACLQHELDRPAGPGLPGGVATLQALQTAAGMVGTGVPATIVVIGSGLDTERPLDHRVIGLAASVPSVVTDLDELGETPELAGVEVLLSGIGQVALPQPRLPQTDVTYLKELWPAIVRSGGGVPHLDADLLPAGPRAADAPGVPVVPPSAVGQVERRQLDGCDTVSRIPDIAFEPNSSVLRIGVPEQLRAEAQRLAPGSGRTGAITGHAHPVGNPAGELARSRDRARVITETLVRLGADPAALTTTGVGATVASGGDPADDRRVEIRITSSAC